MNPELLIPLIVASAGALGGFVAWLVPGGPRRKPAQDAAGTSEPGWLASPLVGAFAALLAWAITDRVSAHVLIGATDPAAQPLQLTWNEVVAAAGTGLIGLKWLSNYQSGKLLREGVTQTALSGPAPEVAAAAPTASAAQLVALARTARTRSEDEAKQEAAAAQAAAAQAAADRAAADRALDVSANGPVTAPVGILGQQVASPDEPATATPV